MAPWGSGRRCRILRDDKNASRCHAGGNVYDFELSFSAAIGRRFFAAKTRNSTKRRIRNCAVKPAQRIHCCAISNVYTVPIRFRHQLTANPHILRVQLNADEFCCLVPPKRSIRENADTGAKINYAISRTGKPLSVAGQRNRLTAVRTWFRFLMRENLILTNPASELELPKPEKRLPKHTLTIEEAEQVLMQPDIETDTGLRDRTILEVLYSTGIRRQEVINLALSDLNTGAGILAVRQGKGRKDRFVPIGERALIWIDKYKDDVRPLHQLPASPDNLFLDETGQALDPHKVSRAVKKYVNQANIDKVGSCHLFRHTMATLMLENGADIRFIQQMLGHAMLSTTEIYTHVAIHKLKEIHTATHPARVAPYGHEGDDPTEEVLLTALASEAAEEQHDDSE